MSGNNGNGNGKGTPNHGIGNGKGQGYDNGKGHEKQQEKELNKPESYEYIRYLNDISVPYPQVLMTGDSKGTYRGVYTYGSERISVRDQVSVEGKPNNPLYYLYDGRGSVSQLTNTIGNVRDQYRYEPFGAPMPGGALEPDTRLFNNPYGYNGEDYDIESNLQYLRARYYNPEIGRFISEDSYLGEIMQPPTLNRYAYTANNPLMYQDPSGHSVVKLGSRGQSVKELQQLLISSGYNGLKVDGIFGKDTLAAVKAYQTSKGLAVDGIVGSQTWGALRNTYTSNPTLRKGSRGGAVTELQQALMRLDYLGPYGADGVFGDKTKRAVKDFQGKNGLDPDGIVGKQTWAALAAKKVISNNRNNCGGSNKKRGYQNTLIFQSNRKKGFDKNGNVANDMKINDFTKNEILAINPMFWIELQQSDHPEILFNELKLMSTDLFAQGEMKNVILDMINHFKNGKGTDYSNATLTKQVSDHATTKAYIKLVKTAFINELAKNNGDLSALQYIEGTTPTDLYKYIQKHAQYPVFNSWKDISGGLTIAINDTWGNSIEVRDYSIDNNKFKGTLHFNIYDHFGLNQPDVEKKYGYLAGFRSWYVLQHYDKYNGKYKPFATVVEIDVPFEGELDK